MGDFEFVVSDGPGRGQSHAFPGNHFYVGSGEDCHLRFDASLVQPRHAEIILDPRGQPWVRDLTGAGMVWVNGEVTEKAQLPAGCFLRLGRLELVVRPRGRAAGPSGTMATPTPIRSGGLSGQRASGVGQQSPARTSGVGQQSAARTSGAGRASGVGQAPRVQNTTNLRAPTGEVPLDATAKRPTPFRQSGVDPLAGYDYDDGLQPPTEATVLSSVLPPGTVIDGRYHVVAKLAAGGMGEVYRAEHVELGKAMALKVMLPELSRDPEFVARFKREAIAASRIGQQNIVDISDFGRTGDGRFYFVMEYLDGLTLASVIHREGALPSERAVSVSLQVARALAAAHAQSIVHRDLKPENIMLLQRPGQPDFVKVLDFGVAKVSHGQGQGGHTAVGMVVGTPQYMSPEQAKAIPVDARSDIYSLGLIIYELVTGRPTFSAETPSMLMVKHVTEAPPPFQPGPLADVPMDLEQLVFQMLEKEPDARPQSMDLVVQALENLWARLRANDPSVRRTSGNDAAVTNPANASGVAVRVSGGHKRVVSSSAGQLPAVGDDVLAPPRRSPVPFVIGGVLVLALLGGGAVLLSRKDEPKPEPTPPVVVTPPPKVDPPPPANDTPAVENVALTFKTVPEKVEVYEGDVLVGTTPFTLERPKDSPPVELTFSAKGYKTATKKVGFVAAQDIAIELDKEARSPGGKKKPSNPGLADDPYSQEEDLKDNPF